MAFFEKKSMDDLNYFHCRRWLPVLITAVLLLAGCQSGDKPRLRVGAFFGSPTGMSFPDPAHLGHHSYTYHPGEKLGMAYTCRGGFIDIGHVREAADRTAYLTRLTYRQLKQGDKAFSFRVIEPSRYRVHLAYPTGWDQLTDLQRDTIARQVSLLLGQYFARTSLVWHEIVTWYGFSSMGIFPENISSFSCEDTYSDLLGTRLGVQALKDPQHSYDDAMTKLLEETLQDLEVQPPEIARKAAHRIEGEWYTGGYYFFVDIKKRNFDVGLGDGLITPMLVPGICPQASPQSYPVPDPTALARYGFIMELEIDPRILEKHKIYRDIGLPGQNRIRPEKDFPEILQKIREHAARESHADGS